MKTQKYLITIEMPDGDMISPSWIQELIQADCNVEDKGRQKVLVEEIKPEVDLENYISNKLRELGADLINHKPYSFNRGLNVGKANAYNDILNRLNARKEE